MRFIALFFLVLAFSVNAQSTKSVLFLGNSYTGVNNLPLLIKNLAESVADTLIYDSNTPGGYTFSGHSTNATSLSKIMAGNWDYVVLQEQSQLPSFPESQVETEVYPFARELDSIINVYNPCGETMFYMTWGRKNGDASNCATWPPVCTYSGMDSLLRLRYHYMADTNHAVLSPVGEVWKYLRENNPEIELYTGDESHPSAAGSYAAACCFYTAIFRKDPTLLTYDFTITSEQASEIRAAAKTVVYDHLLDYHLGEYDLAADFSTTHLGANDYVFNNTSTNYTGFEWNIDGNIFTTETVSFTFFSEGLYVVELMVFDDCDTLILEEIITVGAAGIDNVAEKEILFYPNPVNDGFTIVSEEAILTVEIQDLSGKAIPLKTDGNNTYDISFLSVGTYIVLVKFMNGELGQTRIIKSK